MPAAPASLTSAPLTEGVFKQSPLAFPERTLRKLTESKRPLMAHLPAIAPYLRDGKEPVRLAALAAMAEAKLDAETWAGDIAAALGGSDAEVDLALKSLAAIGKTGAAQLASTLRSDLPTTTRERVYIALGELAAVAPADCCERLIADAEKHPKSADLIARAVASFARGDSARASEGDRVQRERGAQVGAEELLRGPVPSLGAGCFVAYFLTRRAA